VSTLDSDSNELGGRDSIDLSAYPLPSPTKKDKELGKQDSVDPSADPVPPVSGQNIPTNSVPEPSDPPSYIPLSDKEAESNLLREMNDALSSNKAQEQLDWAEKTLRYFHCRSEHDRRTSALRNPSRSDASSNDSHLLHSTAKETVEALSNDHPRALFVAAKYFGFRAANSLVYYHHAATRGFLRANYYLGRHYEKVKQDSAQAHALRYYTTGAEGGDTACRYVRGRLFLVCNN